MGKFEAHLPVSCRSVRSLHTEYTLMLLCRAKVKKNMLHQFCVLCVADELDGHVLIFP